MILDLGLPIYVTHTCPGGTLPARLVTRSPSRQTSRRVAHVCEFRCKTKVIARWTLPRRDHVQTVLDSISVLIIMLRPRMTTNGKGIVAKSEVAEASFVL